MKTSFKTGSNFKSGTLSSEKTRQIYDTCKSQRISVCLVRLIFGINTM